MTTVTVASVAQLRAALADFSVTNILVAPGDYRVSDIIYAAGSGDGFVVNHNVTIKADTTGTARANFYADTDFSKGLFHVLQGVSATFDGIGFYNTANAYAPGQSSNEAGIRHEGINLTILNSHFQNNLNAILGTSLNGPNGSLHGDLVVRNSTFNDNGDQTVGAGQEHHIYFIGRSVTVDQSYFRNSGYGHAIKTVVDVSTTVTNSTIDDGGAPANSAINVTGGGSLTVTGNTITKSAVSGNPYFFYYTSERDGGVSGAIDISNNTLKSLRPAGSEVYLLGNYSDQTATFNGNRISGTVNTFNPFLGDGVGTGNTLDGAAFSLQSFRARAARGTSVADTKVFNNSGVAYNSFDGVNAYDGGDGNDIIIGSFRRTGTDAFFGGNGNDIISGGDGSDYLYGEAGDDIIFTGEAGNSISNDTAFGGAGNDRLIVRPSDSRHITNVYFDGGDGNDILDARYANSSTLIGGSGDDIALGGNGRDDFNGGYGNDIFYGGKGQDVETSGGPADDTGIDTFVFAGAYNVDLKVDVLYGIDELIQITPLTTAGIAEVGFYESPRQFEYLQFSNGSYDVRAKTFTVGLQRVSLATLLATDIPADPGEVTLPYSRLAAVVQYGASVNGTANADVFIQASAGQIINGGDGNDQYVLDLYYGSLSSYPVITETLTGGIDTVFVSPGYINVGGEYTLANNVEIGVTYQLFYSYNALNGNDAANLLVDFDNKNLNIIESNQNVLFNGGAGDDTLYGGNGNDTLIGGAGNDTAVYRGNRADYTLTTVNGTTTVTDTNSAGSDDGVDTLTTIEHLRFLDGTLTLATNTFVAQTNSATAIAYANGSLNLSTYIFSSGSAVITSQPPVITAPPPVVTAPPPVITPPAQIIIGPVILGSLTAGGYPTVSTRTGTAGADNLVGTNGADYFSSPADGSIVDRFTGGDGNDVYVVSNEDVITETTSGGFDVIVGGLNSTIRANVEALVSTADTATNVNGNLYANLLIGNNVRKSFYAGSGDDVIVGGTGSDYFDGGSGNDTAVLTGNFRSYVRSANGSTTTFTHTSRAEADKFYGVEKIRFSDGIYTVATNRFSSYAFTGGLESDLRNNTKTETFLDLPKTFSSISGTGSIFIRGDATDTVAVNSLLLQRYDADYVRAGVTYKHYAYGTNDIFVENGVQLVSPFSGTAAINQADSLSKLDYNVTGSITSASDSAIAALPGSDLVTADIAFGKRANAVPSASVVVDAPAKYDRADYAVSPAAFNSTKNSSSKMSLVSADAQLAQLVQAIGSFSATSGGYQSLQKPSDQFSSGFMLAASN
jgi:Ca2+-binding RTX toxin-like protein